MENTHASSILPSPFTIRSQKLIDKNKYVQVIHTLIDNKYTISTKNKKQNIKTLQQV